MEQPYGEATIQIEEQKYQITNRHLTVIDLRQVHSTNTYSDTSIFICIHISGKYIEKYLPDLDMYQKCHYLCRRTWECPFCSTSMKSASLISIRI